MVATAVGKPCVAAGMLEVFVQTVFGTLGLRGENEEVDRVAGAIRRVTVTL